MDNIYQRIPRLIQVCNSWHSKMISIVTSKITNPRSKWQIQEFKKKLEILRELPNMTQTLNVKNVLEKWLQETCSTQDCYKSFICTTNQRKSKYLWHRRQWSIIKQSMPLVAFVSIQRIHSTWMLSLTKIMEFVP